MRLVKRATPHPVSVKSEHLIAGKVTTVTVVRFATKAAASADLRRFGALTVTPVLTVLSATASLDSAGQRSDAASTDVPRLRRVTFRPTDAFPNRVSQTMHALSCLYAKKASAQADVALMRRRAHQAKPAFSRLATILARVAINAKRTRSARSVSSAWMKATAALVF